MNRYLDEIEEDFPDAGELEDDDDAYQIPSMSRARRGLSAYGEEEDMISAATSIVDRSSSKKTKPKKAVWDAPTVAFMHQLLKEAPYTSTTMAAALVASGRDWATPTNVDAKVNNDRTRKTDMWLDWRATAAKHQGSGRSYDDIETKAKKRKGVKMVHPVLELPQDGESSTDYSKLSAFIPQSSYSSSPSTMALPPPPMSVRRDPSAYPVPGRHVPDLEIDSSEGTWSSLAWFTEEKTLVLLVSPPTGTTVMALVTETTSNSASKTVFYLTLKFSMQGFGKLPWGALFLEGGLAAQLATSQSQAGLTRLNLPDLSAYYLLICVHTSLRPNVSINTYCLHKLTYAPFGDDRDTDWKKQTNVAYFAIPLLDANPFGNKRADLFVGGP